MARLNIEELVGGLLEAAMVAQGIKAVQEPDGSFRPWYIEPDYAYDAEYLMYFYSGESILALLEYYQKSGDTAALATAEAAAHPPARDHGHRARRRRNPRLGPQPGRADVPAQTRGRPGAAGRHQLGHRPQQRTLVSRR